MNGKLDQLFERTLSNENKIKDLTDKMKEIAILEMIKSSNNGDEAKDTIQPGEISISERKTSNKTKHQDERLTKNEEDIFKLKTEVNNLKNNLDNISRTARNNKEAIEGFYPQINDLKSSMKILNNQICTDLKKQIDQLTSFLHVKIKEYDSKLTDYNPSLQPFSHCNIIQDKDDDKSSPKETNQNQQPLPNDINKQLLDLRRHMIEVDKNINKINPDYLFTEIKAIKEELNQKCHINKYSEVSSIVDEVVKQLSILKDQISSHTEDSIGHEDTKSFKKKIEFLMTNLFQLQQSTTSNDNATQNNQNIANFMIDNANKYLEIATFNEFKESLREQLTYLNDHITENRKLIDEEFILLKAKVSTKDLKEMEEVIMGKIEDLKLACQRKFADKIEMGKNIKFLDTQIKHILEINIRTSEKGESWLLAKKPLGGHNCASCENYLGDLKETNQYIPWNKYPMRDQNEKLYRLGNGFSKMLQMVGNDPAIDKKERDQFATSQDFFSSQIFKKDKDKDKERYKESEKDREMFSPQREQSLPKLKIKINSSLSNLSDNDIIQEQFNLSQEEDSLSKPKM